MNKRIRKKRAKQAAERLEAYRARAAKGVRFTAVVFRVAAFEGSRPPPFELSVDPLAVPLGLRAFFGVDVHGNPLPKDEAAALYSSENGRSFYTEASPPLSSWDAVRPESELAKADAADNPRLDVGDFNPGVL